MWSANILILIACVLAGVDAQVQTYSVDQGANCDGAHYYKDFLVRIIDSYCLNLQGQKSVRNVDHLYRYNMESDSSISRYFLPLPFVDAYEDVRTDMPVEHYAVVQDNCDFLHVAKFKYGPPEDLVVTTNDWVVCNPMYQKRRWPY